MSWKILADMIFDIIVGVVVYLITTCLRRRPADRSPEIRSAQKHAIESPQLRTISEQVAAIRIAEETKIRLIHHSEETRIKMVQFMMLGLTLGFAYVCIGSYGSWSGVSGFIGIVGWTVVVFATLIFTIAGCQLRQREAASLVERYSVQ